MFSKLAAVLLLAAFVATTYGCDKFPNNTATALNWFNCPDSGNIVFHTLVSKDASGNSEYPVKLKEPVYINVNLDNNGATYTNIQLDVTLYQWGGWEGCKWSKVPTFGLLNGQDACANGVPCPIKQGKNQNLKIVIDFSKYDAIIGLLQNDAPYQLQYVLTDKASGQTSCTVVQARSLTTA
uniref:ML domain-containing protein n=1 Tax=Rhabditophanes sp. KR3021 TaxID=114890 RepID=A0AC35TLQ0_9BILA